MSIKYFCDWCNTEILSDGTEPMFWLEYSSPNRQTQVGYHFDSLSHMQQKIQQVQSSGT
jgi:hypothetical protein